MTRPTATKGVWQNLLAAGDTMAQRIVRPGARTLAEGQDALKFDLRNYAYNGQVQWVAARLYQGQTTNFRTPGGGFAPVVAVAAGGCGGGHLVATPGDGAERAAAG